MIGTNSFHLGNQFLAEGKLDEAISHFIDALDTHPEAYIKLSETLSQEGNFSLAISVLDTLLDKIKLAENEIPVFHEPLSVSLKTDANRLLMKAQKQQAQKKEKERKEKDKKEKDNKKKELAETYFKKAEDSFQEERYIDAIKFYNKALEQESAMAKASFGLAECYMRQAEDRLKDKKTKVDKVALYAKAEEFFNSGIQNIAAFAEVPGEIYWRLAQAKEGQDDLKGSESYYAMAFKINRDKFCERYVNLAEEESGENLLLRNHFIRHNEDFDAYFESRRVIGEKTGVYFRNAEVYLNRSQLQFAIQQLLLAFIFSATELQTEAVVQSLKAVEIDISLDAFENTTQELLPKELSDLKRSYIKLIRHNFLKERYYEGLRKYNLIKESADFAEFLREDFLTEVEDARAQVEQKKIEIQANLQFKANNYEAAIEYYKEIIKVNPQHNVGYLGVIKCYRQLTLREMRPQPFEILRVSEEAGYLKEIKIFSSEKTKVFYQEADRYFSASLNQELEQSAMSEIYQEFGYLLELQGKYRDAVIWFEKSFSSRDEFCPSHINLVEKTFKSQSFDLIFHFDVILHHEFFQEFNCKNKSNANGNYLLNIHWMYGAIYHVFDEFEAAIQQYLLVLLLSKTDEQVMAICTDLEKANASLNSASTGLSDVIFKNIFNLTTDEELHNVKKGWVKWIEYDLDQSDCFMATKKFSLLLLSQGLDSYAFIDSELLCRLGSAYETVGDANSANACYQAVDDGLCNSEDDDEADDWQKTLATCSDLLSSFSAGIYKKVLAGVSVATGVRNNMK